MSRLDAIRKNGAIPERRHDAFLLALLLAVGINTAVFAAQALLPRLAALLQMLGAEARIAREEDLPFVLVDPSFLDEELPPEAPAATSAINRAARQEESSPAEAEDVYRPEGVEEQLMMAEGNPGEIDPGADSPGAPEIEAIGGDADSEPESAEPMPEAREIPEPEPAEQIPEAAEAVAPEPEPLPGPPPESPPEPPPPQPEEIPEPPREPAPEPVPEQAEPNPPPSPVAELIDLAALPMMDEGIFDPETQLLRDRARQPAPPPAEPLPRPQAPRQPNDPVRPQRRHRENVPQPTFRQLGGAGTAGGAPPRRSMTGRRTELFDDPYMALLRDRYPEYMTKLGRMLQDSLNRTMVFYPNYYATGQSRLLFRISAEGRIDWYETQYPVDGSDNTLRAISERTLLEAGPFDPPPPAMLADPAFQRMSLHVYLY